MHGIPPREHSWHHEKMARVFLSALIALASASSVAAQNHNTSHSTSHSTWRDYGGASDSAQYSELAQIDRSNVGRLEVAWSYPTGDNNAYSFNPIVVDGVLYVLAKNNFIG